MGSYKRLISYFEVIFSQKFVKIAKSINFPGEGVVSGEGVLTLAASGSTVHSEDSIS